MPMSKQDYDNVAGIIKGMQVGALTEREKSLLETLASKIAGYCHRQNPNFLPDRFMTACGF